MLGLLLVNGGSAGFRSGVLLLLGWWRETFCLCGLRYSSFSSPVVQVLTPFPSSFLELLASKGKRGSGCSVWTQLSPITET